MKKTVLLTATGNYWHYNLIGTGVIFTYHVKAKQVLLTCEHTGQLIKTYDLYKDGGFETQEEFKESSEKSYNEFLEDGTTLNLEYMDDPTIVGCVGVDFDLLMN